MNDQNISDQNRRTTLAWAQRTVYSPRNNRPNDPWVIAARYFLDTVDAPEPTLAEEIADWAKVADNEVERTALLDTAGRAGRMETEHTEQTLRIDELDQECDRQNSEILDLTSERDTALEGVERLTAEAGTRKDELKKYRKRCTNQRAEIARLIRDIDGLRAGYAGCRRELGQDRAEVERLTRNIETAEQDRDHANGICRELHRDVADLTDERNRLTADLDRIRDAIIDGSLPLGMTIPEAVEALVRNIPHAGQDAATVAREENVAPDQQGATLPDPADVPESKLTEELLAVVDRLNSLGHTTEDFKTEDITLSVARHLAVLPEEVVNTTTGMT